MSCARFKGLDLHRHSKQVSLYQISVSPIGKGDGESKRNYLSYSIACKCEIQHVVTPCSLVQKMHRIRHGECVLDISHSA